jgi:NAD(P)-dependent dehydrogenase (short-subunit alcohol dehydrogenase family)
METWSVESIELQFGKTALITSGVRGTGLEVARVLADKGAKVIICGASEEEGNVALADLNANRSGALVSFEKVDFADFQSVTELADKINDQEIKIDLLINNAEISNLKERMESAQGHELMFSYNYLAHFLLTAKLFRGLESRKGARIVFQCSHEYSRGALDFFDLDGEQFYEAKKAYLQSKLALLIFARELDRRLRATVIDMRSIPVHAGEPHSSFVVKFLNLAFGQSVKQTALPILFAATANQAISGHFYAPHGLFELWGHPVEIDFDLEAKNIHAAERLWEISQELTGIEFNMQDLTNVIPFYPKGGPRPELFT